MIKSFGSAMIFGILTLFYLIHDVNGASPDGIWLPPLKNITALNKEHAPMWVAQPPYRGTWGILYSCSITLGLCVYTVIHINIPAHKASRTTILIQKIKWMLLALIIPEFVLFTALRQLESAWNIRKMLNNYFDHYSAKVKVPPPKAEIPCTEEPIMPSHTIKLPGRDEIIEECKKERPTITEFVEEQVTSKEKKPKYNLQVGYYILMGGFVIKQNGLIRTLTVENIQTLAENGVFLPVDPEQIADKSKADFLAKFLVCFQVFWMLFETSARKLSGYPLALLEVHVYVHVVCALMMYAIWFEKPVDIRHAVDVTNEIPHDLRDKVQSGTSRVRNYVMPYRPANEQRVSFRLILIGLGLPILMNAMYGGAHLSTWNFDFPTDIERMLWKTSCIITLSGSLVIPGYLTWGAFIWKNGSIVEGTKSLLEYFRSYNTPAKVIIIVIIGPSIATLPFILAARIFLVVESFISLRDVPTGVYATVPWVQYIPHI